MGPGLVVGQLISGVFQSSVTFCSVNACMAAWKVAISPVCSKVDLRLFRAVSSGIRIEAEIACWFSAYSTGSILLLRSFRVVVNSAQGSLAGEAGGARRLVIFVRAV